MQYLEIKDNLKDFIVFSANDILKVDSAFHKQRLSEWQKKGYIKKIAKGYYIFSDLELNESVLFVIANNIYQPSYVSLEIALSYYGLIPESVYSITSISSKPRYSLQSTVGQFSYKQVKPALMFGYQLVPYHNHNFKIAEVEKAILDYFSANTKLKTISEFEELRINKEVFTEKINQEKLKRYLSHFNNKALQQRVNRFIKYINA